MSFSNNFLSCSKDLPSTQGLLSPDIPSTAPKETDSSIILFPSSTEVTSGEGGGSGTPISWTDAGTGTHYWHMYHHEKHQNIQTATDNAVDYLSFTTWDNGTTWYGTVVGRDIK